MIERDITKQITKDLRSKIVLLSGPRQCGKTTLAKSISSDAVYLNFDAVSHRKILLEQSWRRDAELVIFDEIHKKKAWKSWLKGIYDAEGVSPKIIVTGSARLDIAKKMGDSLAGRHFSFRLHPLTLRELAPLKNIPAHFERLIHQGGFPEPFFSEDEHFYNRWQASHLDLILRQDLIDLENVRNISSMETLLELLRYRVGSPVSYQSLSEDVQVDASTIHRWLILLENLFVIFSLTPWSKKISRSLLRAKKYYFYDTGQVLGDNGAKFENMVAHELLSAVHYEQDMCGKKVHLHYLRNKDKNEIDFAIVENNELVHMIEAKWGDDSPSKNFTYLQPSSPLQAPRMTQLVAKLTQAKHYPWGLQIAHAADWLKDLPHILYAPKTSKTPKTIVR